MIKWTEGTAAAILKATDGDKEATAKEAVFMKELIGAMVAVVRGKLNTLERTLMCAMIVLDEHNRTIT